jgi:hypothetical protein
MKQIIKNRYIKSWCFTSSQELSSYLSSQTIPNKLSLEDTYGDFFYCYLCFDSLTSEIQFGITFQSYERDENLNFMYWDASGLFVIETDKNIYFIDYNLNIKFSIEITSPLIGLHLVSESKLLVLEETYFRLVNSVGEILKDGLFDLAVNFKFDGNKLFIKTNDESKVYVLS